METERKRAMSPMFATTAARRRNVAKALRVLALGAAAMTLSGCYTTTATNTVKTAEIAPPIDYRKRHPIAIREGEYVARIFVGTGRGRLTTSQRAEIVAFARSWAHDATGGVVIEIPSGTANAGAAIDSVQEIRGILIAAGVPAGSLGVQSTQPADPDKLATIKLKYPRMVAEAGPCGLWPNDIGPTTDRAYMDNRPYWNLGCSSQRNLAAMVDNPADLAQPRGETPSWGPRRNTVFDKYKKGEDPAGTYRSTDKAKISDVGK